MCIYIYIYIYMSIHLSLSLYIYIYIIYDSMLLCMYIYIYIYVILCYIMLYHILRGGRRRRGLHEEPLHGDAIIISPAILSTSPCTSKKRPWISLLWQDMFKHIKVFSEITVGEIIIKSPYRASAGSLQLRPPSRPGAAPPHAWCLGCGQVGSTLIGPLQK